MIYKKKNLYPAGLLHLAITNTGNIVAIATISSILVLYCTQFLHIPVKHAYAIYAAFGSIYYSASLLGGYLGGRYDYTVSFVIGCLFGTVGGFILANTHEQGMYYGLATLIVGSGLIVPNLYCLIGKVFHHDDPVRESGFTVVYIVANIVGMLIAFLSGFITRFWGYHAAFLICGVFIFVTLIIFLLGFSRLKFVPEEDGGIYQAQINKKNILTITVISLCFVFLIRQLLNYALFSNVLLFVVGSFVLLSVIYFALREKDPQARKKLFAFFIFITIGITFWIMYMLAPSALMIFVQNNVNRHFGHFVLPAASAYALGPGFIILAGLIFNAFLVRMAKHNKTFSVPGKFSVGIILAGLGYIALVIGIYFASRNGMVAFLWIGVCYFLQSFGELLIGPTSYSMVGSLCPARLEGFMMGTYRLSIGTAGAVSCFIAGATAAPKGEINPLVTNHIYSHMFGLYGTVTLVIGILIWILTPKFKKLWE